MRIKNLLASIFLACAVLLLFPSASFAQEGPRTRIEVEESCRQQCGGPDTPGFNSCFSNCVNVPFPGANNPSSRARYQIPELQEFVDGVAANEDGSPNQSGHTLGVFEGILGSMAVQGAGTDNLQAMGIDTSGLTFSTGLMENLTDGIIAMYSYPPAQTNRYVAYVLQEMNIAQPAYAQGLGFASLEPILSAWTIFRNIAYLFFVVIFLIIGFMIMFRQKIGSQSAITAQQAIPSIIVSLLAVTFSYAIAGVLVDMMYLVMFMLNGVLNFEGTDLIGMNVLGIAQYLLSSNILGQTFETVTEIIDGALGNNFFSLLGGFIGGLSALIIVLVIVLFNVFKLFIQLLRVYVELILAIVFSPLILMMGAIPGRNTFGPWLRSIIGNLAVFPAILLLLLVFQLISQNMSNGNNQVGGFAPPYLQAGFASNLAFIAALAIIVVLPSFVDEVRKAAGANEQGGFLGGLIRSGLKEMWDKRKYGTEGMIALPRAGISAIAGARNPDAFLQDTKGKGRVAGFLAGLGGPRRIGRFVYGNINRLGELEENTGLGSPILNTIDSMTFGAFRPSIDKIMSRGKFRGTTRTRDNTDPEQGASGGVKQTVQTNQGQGAGTPVAQNTNPTNAGDINPDDVQRR